MDCTPRSGLAYSAIVSYELSPHATRSPAIWSVVAGLHRPLSVRLMLALAKAWHLNPTAASVCGLTGGVVVHPGMAAMLRRPVTSLLLLQLNFIPISLSATSHACHSTSSDRGRPSTSALPEVNCNHWAPLAQSGYSKISPQWGTPKILILGKGAL
jgi:hypothetical protein